MTERVTVEISGMGEQTDGTSPVVVLSQGTYKLEDGMHTVCFEEELEGLDRPLDSVIKFGPGHLRLKRKGEISADMEFREGVPTSCRYESPYGTVMLETMTKRVDFRELGGEMRIYVLYSMKTGPEVMDGCMVKIHVRPVN